MATTVELIVKARDEASAALTKLGTSLQSVAKMGLEPIAKVSPTAANALGGLLNNLGPTALAIGAIGGAAVAAVGGMYALTKSFADGAEKLDNLSTRFGVAVETLSSLRVAAELNETSLDAVAGAFNKMAKSIDAAAQGGKEQIETFNRLGISVNDLMRMDPEQQFEALAKAISALPNPTEQVAVAMQVFGKSAAEIIPLLNDVANRGMADLKREAKELGLVMSGETARGANDFTDQLSRIKLAGEGLTNVIGAALLPAFNEIATSMLEGVKSLIAWEQQTHTLSTTFTALGEIIRGVGAIVVEVAKAFGVFLQVLTSIGTFIADPTGRLEVLNKQIAEFDTGAKKAAPSATAMGAAMAGAAPGAKQLETALSGVIKGITEFAPGLDDVKKKLELAQFGENIKKAMGEAKALFDAGKLSVADYNKVIEEMGRTLERANSQGFVPAAEGAKALAGSLEKTAYGAKQLAIATLEAAKGELWQKFMEGRISVDKLHEGIQALNVELEKAASDSLPKTAAAATATSTAVEQLGTAAQSSAEQWMNSMMGISQSLDEIIAKSREAASAISSANAAGNRAGGGGGGGAGGGGGVSYAPSESYTPTSGLQNTYNLANQPTGSGLTPFNPAYNLARGGVIPGTATRGVPIIAHGKEVYGPPQTIIRAMMEAQRRMGGGWGGGGTVVNIHPGAIAVSGTVVQAERDFATLTEHMAQSIAGRIRRRR